jgi:hypothetical protein
MSSRQVVLDSPGGRRRKRVDGPQFDALTQRLASIRLSRKRVLRGLVGGAVALTGGVVFTGETEAKKKKSICHCDTGGACATQKVKKKQRKVHLSEHQCDYMGECQGTINDCQATPIIVNINRLGDPCSSPDDCGGNSGLECVAGFCVPIDLSDDCTNNGECSTGRCDGTVCVECPAASFCQTETGPQCCAIGYHCGAENICVL